jgi:malonate transporter and related proteins
MVPAFSALLPVFLAILAGCLLRYTLLPDEAHWVGLERLTYYVLTPALIIEALATADLGRIPALGVGAALFIATIIMSALLIVGQPMLMQRLRINGPSFTSVFQGATRWNSMVAIAVAGSLYGDIGIALIAVAMVAMIPILNIVNVWILARNATAMPLALKDLAKAIAGNPMIWSCAAGGALCVLQLPIPQPVHGFADMLGRAAIALGLLTAGSGLEIHELYRPRPAALVTTALKLALMPAFAIAFGLAFRLSGASLAVVAAAAAVPTASNAYVLARQMGGDAPLVAQILTLQTIVAVVTMPLILSLVE